MKNTHHCPKCDSTKIVIQKGSKFSGSSIGAVSKWGAVKALIDRYFCINCGYTEEYAQMSKQFIKWGNKMLEKQGWTGGDFV